MPWVGFGEAPRPSNAPKRRASARLFGRSKTRLAIRPKRTSKINVSRREKPITGPLVFIFRFFACLQFSPHTCRTLTVDPAAYVLGP